MASAGFSQNRFESIVDPEENIVTKSISSILEQNTSLEIRTVLFQVAVGVPIACAIIQLILWSQFDLTGSKLQMIKHSRNKIEQIESEHQNTKSDGTMV